MTERESQFAVRRILLALDTTARNLPSFESAVELASQLEAELAALFIEDPNLLRLAGLSFAREIRFPSATEEETEPARIERELRVLAEQMRQALAAAERAKLRWSFRVVRGAIATELRAAVTEADLLLLGARARPKLQTLAVFLGLTDDSRVLAAASRVAEAMGGDLIVLLPPQPA
jgi:nucleotide-binding universal stress UspA family protein